MKNATHYYGRCVRNATLLAALALLSACAASPEQPSDLERARSQLRELQADPAVANRAPLAVREAELALAAAESAVEEDDEAAEHLVFIAEHKIDIAQARAQMRLTVDQREELREERERLRLTARTREAEQAQRAARQANLQAQASQEESAELRRELEALNAKPTERGLVLTLGDVLFETDESDIKAGAHNDLDRLAEFLQRYPERVAKIEGHTDSVGSADYNRDLSERRAEAVESYLMSQGVSARRLTTQGRGENVPIASNATAGGRQLNRRVEIIIENPEAAG